MYIYGLMFEPKIAFAWIQTGQKVSYASGREFSLAWETKPGQPSSTWIPIIINFTRVCRFWRMKIPKSADPKGVWTSLPHLYIFFIDLIVIAISSDYPNKNSLFQLFKGF